MKQIMFLCILALIILCAFDSSAQQVDTMGYNNEIVSDTTEIIFLYTYRRNDKLPTQLLQSRGYRICRRKDTASVSNEYRWYNWKSIDVNRIRVWDCRKLNDQL